jgi:hypothetical protein
VAFGVLMLIAVGRYFAHGWIEQFFILPQLFFPYPGLEWIVPLPPAAMYALFAGLGVCAAGIALGCWYRASAALFCAGFTYAHLIDRTNYLNHYYLISLVSLLLVFVPAHRVWSLDAWRRPRNAAATVPAWAVWVLRFQIAVVYVFGAVAKLNPDWLLEAQPLRIWLGANLDVPLIGAWFEERWVAYGFSYLGLAFDACIVPLLLLRRTRALAYVGVLAFHLLTALLFPIGMFPWLMIGLTPIFFTPDWPRRLVRRLRTFSQAAGNQEARIPSPSPVAISGHGGGSGRGLLLLYAVIQIAIPLRHLVLPGNLYWSENGMRWSWQIMVMEKYGRAAFTVSDPVVGDAWPVVPSDELTPLQTRMMATQPDMILSYAQHLARRIAQRRGHGVEVRADVRVSLNGRPQRHLIDPGVDLARVTPEDLPAVVMPLESDDGSDSLIAAAR